MYPVIKWKSKGVSQTFSCLKSFGVNPVVFLKYVLKCVEYLKPKLFEISEMFQLECFNKFLASATILSLICTAVDLPVIIFTDRFR